MSSGQANWGTDPVGQTGSGVGWRSLFGGLAAAALVVLTLLAASVLTSQDQALVAGSVPTATATHTQSPPSVASPILAMEQPVQPPKSSPTATLSPSPSPTPTRTRLLQSLFKAEPTPSLTPSPSRSPLPTETLQAKAAEAKACKPKPPSGWRRYVVRRGDTISGLSARFRVSAAKLKRVNCLTSSRLRAGTKLWVPYRKPKPKPYGSILVVPPELNGESPLPAASPGARVLSLIAPAVLIFLLAMLRWAASAHKARSPLHRLRKYATNEQHEAGQL